MKNLFTNWFKRLLKKLLGLFTVFLLLSVVLVSSLNFFNPPIWMWKLQRQIMPPDNFPVTIQHQWEDLADISNNMKLAVIAAEDQLFPGHLGFDFDSIFKVLSSRGQDKAIRGASTISQQTIKNLFLWPGRSWIRKGLEAGLTIIMELMVSKQRILEIYLNIVEFGPGIFGVEAASQTYFNKSAARLSHHEAAQMAAVLPNPYRFKVINASAYTRNKVRWIEKQMKQLGTGYLKPLGD